MGQRNNSANFNQQMSIFLTELGWMGLAGSGNRVHRLTLGHGSDREVRDALVGGQDPDRQPPREDAEWQLKLRRRLQQYGQGEYVDFSDVHVVFPKLTAFQEAVIFATRAIGYGQTVSYGELAELAGYPRAARAVGSVMSSNPLPILIPCHRVVGSGGKLGGYSAPQGIPLKQSLLAMEAEGVRSISRRS